jgi:hypothetical protein
MVRGKFLDALRRAYREKRLQLYGTSATLQCPRQFQTFIDALFRQSWVVYAKPAMSGAPQGPAVSKPLHSPGRHQQPSSAGLRGRPGHFPVEGLCPWQQEAENDRSCRRISPPLFTARSSTCFRPHPTVWIPANARRISLLALARELIAQSVEPKRQPPPTSILPQSHTARSSTVREGPAKRDRTVPMQMGADGEVCSRGHRLAFPQAPCSIRNRLPPLAPP